MIIGIGIDTVEIARFNHWNTFTRAQLLRIFSASEIDHCLEVPAKRAERFAVRFAAREAFFKAVAPMVHTPLPLLTVCTAITITHTQTGMPHLTVEWKKLAAWVDSTQQPHTTPFISLTHTQYYATALVILETQK